MTTTQQPGDPMWASFQDVVQQITHPVANAAVDRIAAETTSLGESLASLTTMVAGLSARQEETNRKARQQAERQSEDVQALATRIDEIRPHLTAAVEQARNHVSTDIEQRTAELARELSELTAVSSRLDQMGRAAAASAEESRRALAELGDTLSAALKETADVIRDRDLRLQSGLESVAASLGTSVGADLQAFQTKTVTLTAQLASAHRLTRIAASLSLAVAIAACVIAALR